jgi:LysM repeat protein
MPRRLWKYTLLTVLGVIVSAGAAFAQDSGSGTPTATPVPESSAAATSTPAPITGTSGTYTVKAGDTLDGIAAIYDVQVECLAKNNNVAKANEIKPGQVLLISFDCPRYEGVDFVTNPRTDSSGQGGGGAPPPGQGGGGVEAGPNDKTYDVKRGDMLDSIGQQFNVSVVSLQQANKLGPRSVLMPGMKLVIPADAPPYGQFPAVASASDLGQGGGGAPPPGQGGGGAPPPGQGGGGVEAGPNDKTYVVQPQETLDGIGAKFDTQVACLAKNNNLSNPRRIFPGQTLIIFASCPRYDGFDIVTTPRTS